MSGLPSPVVDGVSRAVVGPTAVAADDASSSVADSVKVAMLGRVSNAVGTSELADLIAFVDGAAGVI